MIFKKHIFALFLLAMIPNMAIAQTISNPVVALAGLDKITGRLIDFDVYIDETVQFGALQITPRACYSRPASNIQQTSVFLEIDQISLDGKAKRIFTGWMLAGSPSLNAIDHAIYDVWLDDCKQSSDVLPPESR